jgi:pyruvate dehydrogenase E1 component
VILARTIKGYGIGEAGEGKNITHQQKKLNEDELQAFRTRFGIPIGDEEVAKAPFYRPPTTAPKSPTCSSGASSSVASCRRGKSRSNRSRRTRFPKLFSEFHQGSEGRKRRRRWPSCGCSRRCFAIKRSASSSWPIVPDEARTSGMEALFRRSASTRTSAAVRAGRHGHAPVLQGGDRRADLEEGITEAGIDFIIHRGGQRLRDARHQHDSVLIYYSMFGMQRVGDLVWAAADTRTRGFLLGGTAGRTTLAGEGLQHQDGHSHLLSLAVPNLIPYDPAFAYEIAVDHRGRHPPDVRTARASSTTSP